MTTDVALVTPYPVRAGRSHSGVAWYSQSLAHALSDAGLSVTVLAPVTGGNASAETDGAVRVRRCFARGPRALLDAASAAVATGAPVSHVQHEAFLYGGPAAMPGLVGGLARLRRAGSGPVVTMHQVVDPSRVDKTFTRLHRVNIPAPIARAGLATLQRTIAGLASRIIVHDESFRASIPGSVVLPIGSARPSGARPVVDDSRVPARARELRVSHGASDSALLVLCFGFVAPYKGIEIALEAAGLAGPAVRLVIAGGEHPRLSGQGYLEALKGRYARSAAFAGYVSDDDVAAWFAAADAVLLPYPQAFSSSGVLALAVEHDVPALLSPSLGAVSGVPAHRCIPLDPGALADRLKGFAASRSDLVPFAELTRKLGVGRSWDEVAARHMDVYEEVTNSKRSAAPNRRARSHW